MKLIGKNSASNYLQMIFLALFVFFVFHFIYEMFGFAITLLNYKNGTHYFSEFFILGKDVGWDKNLWTDKMEGSLKFKFYYPFTKSNLLTGLFGLPAYYMAFFGMGYFSEYTYMLYKLFSEFKKDNFFNERTIQFLKIFAWINVLYLPPQLIIANSIGKINFSIIETNLAFMFFGIVLLFVIEFFKKGVELQSENDLTI